MMEPNPSFHLPGFALWPMIMESKKIFCGCCGRKVFASRLCQQLQLPKKCSRSEGTRLNSSHLVISYAVFCLKKKKNIPYTTGSKESTCVYSDKHYLLVKRQLHLISMN